MPLEISWRAGKSVQDWVNLICGVLLFISPWALGFAGDMMAAWTVDRRRRDRGDGDRGPRAVRRVGGLGGADRRRADDHLALGSGFRRDPCRGLGLRRVRRDRGGCVDFGNLDGS